MELRGWHHVRKITASRCEVSCVEAVDVWWETLATDVLSLQSRDFAMESRGLTPTWPCATGGLSPH